MAKIIKFPTTKNKSNEKVIKDMKDSEMLEEAFSKLKEQTGLDHRKLIFGDPREKRKQEMLYAQAKMIED